MGGDSLDGRLSELAARVSGRRASQLLWLIPLAYLLQNLAMPFNHSSEEALLADILRAIHAGELPYRDFIDIYGPVNWILPSLVYGASGGKWIAIRASMVALQLGIAVLGYQLVRRLSSRFHAWLAGLMMVSLFGMAWFLHYAPYAFMLVYPMTLGIIWLLTRRDESNALERTVGAGILAGLAALTKLSSGAFLLAGGLFVCFFLLSPVTPIRCKDRASPSTPAQKKVFVVQIAGLMVFGLVFSLFIRPHYEWGYALHLSLPLMALLACTALEERDQMRIWTPETVLEQLHQRLRHSVLFAAACLGTIVMGLLVIEPFGMLEPMVDGLASVLSHVDYYTPFDSPVIGKPLYRFDRAHWPVLPVLVAVLAVAAFLSCRKRSEHAADPTGHAVQRLQLLGFFAISVVAHHVIYPTGDLGHLLQSFVPWILLLPLCLFHLEQNFAGRTQQILRAVVALGVVAWTGAILELPIDFERYRWRSQGHAGLAPEADFLKLRSDFPHLYDYGDFSRPQFQKDLIRVSTYLKEQSWSEDRVWVLSPYFSIYFYSGLPMYGGHDRWLYYSMTHGRLSRDGFEAIRTVGEGSGPFEPLPRFIVDSPGAPSAALRGALPELDGLLRDLYSEVLTTENLQVYRRDPN
jgi:hypothetical protein